MPLGLAARLARLRRHWIDAYHDAALVRARRLAQAGKVAEAIPIWVKLARSGVPRAMTNLGACYANGQGVAQDDGLARHWLQQGAMGGDALGQRNLATLMLEEDPAAAAHWYQHAAGQGDAVSQDQLSAMLLDGGKVPQDVDAAWRWATRAAAQDIASSAYRLGTMLHDGLGRPRDAATAVRWWRQAAGQGHSAAAAMLGAAYYLGQGVAADPVEALAWLLVSAGQHERLAHAYLGRVRDSLSEDQQGRAKQLAMERGWTDPGPT